MKPREGVVRTGLGMVHQVAQINVDQFVPGDNSYSAGEYSPQPERSVAQHSRRACECQLPSLDTVRVGASCLPLSSVANDGKSEG